MSFQEAWNLAFPPFIGILAIIAAIFSGVGFYKFVYFLSIGYGLSVSGIGVALIMKYNSSISFGCILLCLLFILYGLRLSGFLLIRELKSISYRKTLEETTNTDKPMPFFVKIVIWISVVALYLAQTSPVFYRLANNQSEGFMTYICAAIMAIALLIETIADMQKSAIKKKNSKRFCDVGLYKLVRCPNYFGEVLFWLGVFLSGFGALIGIWQWIIAVLGFILIIYVMFSGAKRLENRQNKSYGMQKDYQEYVKKTPILIPFIPLFSLKDWGFIK